MSRTQTWRSQYPSGGIDTSTEQPTIVNSLDVMDASQINAVSKGLRAIQRQVGKVHYVSDYGNDLAKTIYNLSGAAGTVVVPSGSTITLTSSYTVPTSVNLHMYNGAVIDYATHDLIISGNFVAPVATVFTGTVGTITFGPYVDNLIPEWWGNVTYSGDATIALQKCLAAAINKTVHLKDRVYGTTASLAPSFTTVIDGHKGTIKANAAMEVVLNVDTAGYAYAPDIRVSVKDLIVDANGLATDGLVVSGGANYHRILENCRVFGAVQDNIHLIDIIGGYVGPNMYSNGAGRYDLFVEGCNATKIGSLYTTGGGAANVFVTASHVVNGQGVVFDSLVSEAGSGKGVIVQDTSNCCFIDPWLEANTLGGIQFISASGVIVDGRFNGSGTPAEDNRWLVMSASNVVVLNPSISTQGVTNWDTASVSADSYLGGIGVNAAKGVFLGSLTQTQRGSGAGTAGRLIFNSSSTKVEFDDGSNWQRFKSPITPFAYGAVGDGITADNTAISNADLAASTKGEPLVFPSGTFKVASPLTLISQVIFEEGAKISGVGVDLTFNQAPIIGQYHVFTIGGGNSYTLKSGPANPKWFGAVGDGTTNDISAVLAANNAAGSMILSNGTYRLSTTTTLDVPIHAESGAVFKPAGSLIFNKRINAGLNTVFDLSLGGTVAFAYNTGLNVGQGVAECYIDWFGADSTGVADSSTALSSSIYAMRLGGTIKLGMGNYLMTAGNSVSFDGIHIKGEGHRSQNSGYLGTNIVFSGSGICLDYINTRNSSLKDLKITCDETAAVAGRHGVRVWSNGTAITKHVEIKNVSIAKPDIGLIHGSGSGLQADYCEFDMIDISDARTYAVLLDTTNNDGTVLSNFIESGAPTAIEVKSCGIYELRNISVNPTDVGVHFSGSSLERFTIDGYNQESGNRSLVFDTGTGTGTHPFNINRFSGGSQAIHVTGANNGGAWDRPITFAHSNIRDFVLKADSANIIFKSCEFSASGSFIIDGDAKPTWINCVDNGIQKLFTPKAGIEIADSKNDGPTLFDSADVGYKLNISDSGSMLTELQTLLPDEVRVGSTDGWSNDNVSLSTTLAYKGSDLSGSNWAPYTGSGTITEVSTGTSASVTTTINGFGEGEPLASAVEYYAGIVHQASGSAVGNLTTEDFIIELVFKYGAVGDFIFSKRDATSTGYEASINGANKLAFTFSGSSGVVSPTSLTALTSGSWYHVVIGADKDEASSDGGRIYVNGVLDSAGLNFSSVGNISSSLPLTFAARADLSFKDSIGLAHFRIMSKSEIFQGGGSTINQSYMNQFAAQRYKTLKKVLSGSILPFRSSTDTLRPLEGRIAYDAVTQTVQYGNGTSWITLATSSA